MSQGPLLRDDGIEVNPYQSPAAASTTPSLPPLYISGRSSGGRFLAAQIDHAFGVVLFLTVGMNLGEIVGDIPAGIAAFSSYMGYYFIPEWLFGATIGKSLFSLRVRQLSGARCTAKQAAIRTFLRLLEVNPLFLGALPAGISILATQRKQRIGDLLAGTVVVHQQQIRGGAGAAQSIQIIRHGDSET